MINLQQTPRDGEATLRMFANTDPTFEVVIANIIDISPLTRAQQEDFFQYQAGSGQVLKKSRVVGGFRSNKSVEIIGGIFPGTFFQVFWVFWVFQILFPCEGPDYGLLSLKYPGYRVYLKCRVYPTFQVTGYPMSIKT